MFSLYAPCGPKIGLIKLSYLILSYIFHFFYFWRKFLILEMQNLNTYIISLEKAFQTIYYLLKKKKPPSPNDEIAYLNLSES